MGVAVGLFTSVRVSVVVAMVGVGGCRRRARRQKPESELLIHPSIHPFISVL